MLTQAPEGTTVDQINYALEEVLHGKFANPYIIVTDVRAVLERFSMNLPMLDEVDGKVGDVDTDPFARGLVGMLAVQSFDGVDGGAAAAEGVEDDVAGVGGGGDDTGHQ